MPPRPESLPPAPGSAPAPGSYGGPVPPGGWSQPVHQPPAGGRRLAEWGPRFAAAIIDGIIITVPTLIIAAVFGLGALASGGAGNDAGVVAFIGGLIAFVLVAVVVAFVYAPLLMMRKGERNGQTLGKQALNIRVVRADGRPVELGLAILREIVLKGLAVGIASSIVPLIPFLLDYLWPLWDDENRALHDIAASTRVVAA